eukprot:1948200-Prymnesium_polylepis.1
MVREEVLFVGGFATRWRDPSRPRCTRLDAQCAVCAPVEPAQRRCRRLDFRGAGLVQIRCRDTRLQ